MNDIEDMLYITYDKAPNKPISAIIVGRRVKDTYYILNTITGTEASTIYDILIGNLKLATEQKIYLTIPERKNADEKNI